MSRRLLGASPLAIHAWMLGAGTETVTIATVTGIVAEGDSLTANGSPNYPEHLSVRTGLDVINRATSGHRLFDQIIPNYSTDVAPYYDAGHNTLIIHAGTNDIGISGRTDVQLEGDIQTFCASARATGFRVYVGTLTARSDAGWDATKEGYRTSYNTWLRANYASFADGLIDFDAVPEFADPNSTTYFADKLHHTNYGFAIKGEYARQQLGLAVSPSLRFALPAPYATTQNIAYTNAERKVSNESDGTDASVATNTAVSGKKVFAVTVSTQIAASHAGVGLVTIGSNSGVIGFDGTRSIGYFSNGSMFLNSVAVLAAGSIPTFTVGDSVGVVIDEAAGLMWVTKDGTNFYGSSTTARTKAEVEAGTGGRDISTVKANGSLYGAVGFLGTFAGSFTLLTAWPWTTPTGYTYLAP